MCAPLHEQYAQSERYRGVACQHHKLEPDPGYPSSMQHHRSQGAVQISEGYGNASGGRPGERIYAS